jgi:AcrR family transcriptional regulator
MAAPVEHDKRQKKILEKALAVFEEEGFENATYQKIADKCGITRTILYLYFKNKKEIFIYSIKQFLMSIEEKLTSIQANNSLSCQEKLTKVLFEIFTLLEKNLKLLFVLIDYLLHISKKDVNPAVRVKRRILKLQHILANIIVDGMKSGEFKKTSAKKVRNYLHTFIETAVYQLSILKIGNLDELKEAVVFAVEQLKA